MGAAWMWAFVGVTAVIVLASASPRRRELLARAGVSFEVDVADVDETMRPGEAPLAYGARVAWDKASVVAARRGGSWVIAADTIVVTEGEVLGKAADEREAADMVRRLVGRTHEVTTSVAIAGAAVRTFAVTTEVVMRALAPADIDAYVATGEWRGKAGAYAAQGIAAAFISEIRGSYTNVVGLPLSEVLVALADVGAPAASFRDGVPQ